MKWPRRTRCLPAAGIGRRRTTRTFLTDRVSRLGGAGSEGGAEAGDSLRARTLPWLTQPDWTTTDAFCPIPKLELCIIPPTLCKVEQPLDEVIIFICDQEVMQPKAELWPKSVQNVFSVVVWDEPFVIDPLTKSDNVITATIMHLSPVCLAKVVYQHC